MGIKTYIEWSDSTVNPTENCDGCELWNTKSDIRKCYAGKMVERVNFVGLGAGLDWMIIEGESGGGQTAILETETVRESIRWCRENQVSPFVKQMGSAWAKKYGDSHFKGGNQDFWPDDIRIKEMPGISKG